MPRRRTIAALLRVLLSPLCLAVIGGVLTRAGWRRSDPRPFVAAPSQLPAHLRVDVRWSVQARAPLQSLQVLPAPDGSYVILHARLAHRSSLSQGIDWLRRRLPGTASAPLLDHIIEARDLPTGRVRWRRWLPLGTPEYVAMEASEQRVYVISRSRLHAYEAQGGRTAWIRPPLVEDPGSTYLRVTEPLICCISPSAVELWTATGDRLRLEHYLPNPAGYRDFAPGEWPWAWHNYPPPVQGPGATVLAAVDKRLGGQILTCDPRMATAPAFLQRARRHLRNQPVLSLAPYDPQTDRWYARTHGYLHAFDGTGRCRWEHFGVADFAAAGPGVLLAPFPQLLDARTGKVRALCVEADSAALMFPGRGWVLAEVSRPAGVECLAVRISDGRRLWKLPAGSVQLTVAGSGVLAASVTGASYAEQRIPGVTRAQRP